MDLVLRDRLLTLASEFRAACWEYSNKVNKSNNVICGFPGGCCDSSSRLLGAYLEDKGFSGATYIVGKKLFQGFSKCHVWINYKSWNIDITADQFGEEYPPVIVATDADRHLGFRKIGVGSEASYRNYYRNDPHGGLDDYECVYDQICSLIGA